MKFIDETSSGKNCIINALQLEKLMQKGVIGVVIYSKTLLKTGENMQSTPAEIQVILNQFLDVF